MSRSQPNRTAKLALVLALPLVAGVAWLAARLPDQPGGSIQARREATVPAPASDPEAFVPREAEGEGRGRDAAAAARAPAAPAPPGKLELGGTAPLRGVLVDAADGSPLACWRVRVEWTDATGLIRDEDWTSLAPATTGPTGEFICRPPSPAGRYRIRSRMGGCTGLVGTGSMAYVPTSAPLHPLDQERRDGHVLHVPGYDPARDEPLRLSIETGPRYRVLTALPAGTGACDFEAFLARVGEERERPRNLGVLAQGEPWEARFELPVRGEGDAEGPWALLLRSTDGRYAGAAEVDSIYGTCASPVAIELVARSEVRGWVFDADGEPAIGARVSWTPDHEPPVRDFDAATKTDRWGAYVLDSLPAGAGTLHVEASGVAAVERRLELPAHGRERADVRLDELRTGELAGSLVCDGELLHPPRLALRALDPGGDDGPPVRFEVRGPGLATFRFERVPVGEYELVVEPVDGRVWEPASQRVRVPSSGHVIRRSASASTMVVLDVLDAHDRAPVSGAFALLSAGGELLRSEGNPPGTVLLDHVERHLGASLVVGAPGHVAQVVALGALRRNGRFLAGEVLLQRGATSSVRVVEAESGRGLEGALVRADTGETATTDRAGLAHLPVARDEATFTCALEGWEHAGAGGTGDLLLVLQMKRAE